MRHSIILLFAKQFWFNLFKSQILLPLVLVFSGLAAYSSYMGWQHYTMQNQLRQRYQTQVRQDWEAMPDKHPHRMAHYGYLAFRLKHPLSMFDNGLESYLGNSVFLEAHKQNTINFSEASFSTGLLRFGEISLAFLLQIVLPLIIVFLGFDSIAKEREEGTLKMLFSQGVHWRELILGKTLGLLAVIMIFFAPIFILINCLSIIYAEHKIEIGFRLVGLWLSHFIFFTLISFGTIALSAVSQTAKTALIRTLGLWLVLAIVLPRTLQALGNYVHPAPSKMAFEAAIEQEIIKIGDSHNPDDPHYKTLKDSLLRAYKVDSVQKLPFNYSGFVMAEGERISAAIYNQHLKKRLEIYEKQNKWNEYAAFISPFSAISRISMSLSGTDFNAYTDFQRQTESFRYQLAQHMNALQIQYISNKKPAETDKPSFIDKKHWKEMPDFEHQLLKWSEAIKHSFAAWIGLGFGFVMIAMSLHYISKKITI